MNQSNFIKAIFIVILVAIVAIWIGVNIATDQVFTLIKVGGSVLLLVCALLGRRIWLLMVFFVALNIPLIRGFGTAELGEALFLAFSIGMFLMRRLPLRFQFGELEFWMLLLAACIVQTYLRNPVGLNMLGASAVGARPYAMAALAFATGGVLSLMVVDPSEIKWAVRLSIIGTFIGIPVLEFRTRAGLAAVSTQAGAGYETERITGLGTAGNAGIHWIVSAMSPFKVLIRPFVLVGLLVFLAATMGSGFRNHVATAGLFLIFGVYYHNGLFATFVSGVVAALMIACLAVVNVVSPLPGNMQRALSPFPGTWEERHVRQAELSTEWRIEMWKEALFTDHWIDNKLLGDGLGFTQRELKVMQSMSTLGMDNYKTASGMTNQQESMMISGGYHSGPVQTVRTVGYVGLAVLLLAMFRMAVRAHRLIRNFHGTEWGFASKFIGLPIVILPIFFTLIFGEFGRDVAVVLFGFGMLRLFEKSVPLPHRVGARSLAKPLISGPRYRQRTPGEVLVGGAGRSGA